MIRALWIKAVDSANKLNMEKWKECLKENCDLIDVPCTECDHFLPDKSTSSTGLIGG